MPRTLPSTAYSEAIWLFLLASVSVRSARYSEYWFMLSDLWNIRSGSSDAEERIFMELKYSGSALNSSMSISTFG